MQILRKEQVKANRFKTRLYLSLTASFSFWWRFRRADYLYLQKRASNRWEV